MPGLLKDTLYTQFLDFHTTDKDNISYNFWLERRVNRLIEAGSALAQTAEGTVRWFESQGQGNTGHAKVLREYIAFWNETE
jgi:hypothetical protein